MPPADRRRTAAEVRWSPRGLHGHAGQASAHPAAAHSASRRTHCPSRRPRTPPARSTPPTPHPLCRRRAACWQPAVLHWPSTLGCGCIPCKPPAWRTPCSLCLPRRCSWQGARGRCAAPSPGASWSGRPSALPAPWSWPPRRLAVTRRWAGGNKGCGACGACRRGRPQPAAAAAAALRSRARAWAGGARSTDRRRLASPPLPDLHLLTGHSSWRHGSPGRLPLLCGVPFDRAAAEGVDASHVVRVLVRSTPWVWGGGGAGSAAAQAHPGSDAGLHQLEIII